LINSLEEISVQKNNLTFKEKANIAFTGQLVFSEIMTELLNNIYKFTNCDNLIYTGGCALNSSFNGQILQKTKYKRLYVPSAPGDDGNALGAALLSYYKHNIHKNSTHRNLSPYLGSTISSCSFNNFLTYSGIKKIKFLPGRICEVAASLIVEGKLIGWVQGRAEYGPRALGNRSILADPRSNDMKEKINRCIKFREEFRPLAPSILHEYGQDYFENYHESPFMEKTFTFKKEVLHKVPAVVHLDNTGRLQSVTKEANNKFYHLIQFFFFKTNIPLIVNTSFNIMGKPIIHTLEDAISVFYTSGLDALIIGDYLIEK
jgi:carbamoyltransferase